MTAGQESWLGARTCDAGGVAFRVWGPRCRTLGVHIVSGKGQGLWPLEQDGAGYWTGTVATAEAGSDYFLRLDDGSDVPDPASRWQPAGVPGPSRVVELAHTWTDAGWSGVPREELSIYELHVGTFSPEGSFDGVRRALPELADLGIRAIELMPLAEFPGERNWGYDGVFLFAPQSSYGGPSGLASLVDAAHAHGIAVLLDVVYNHLGPEGNVLPRFGPYFTNAYRTPWGDAINFDGPQSDGVRDFVISNALYWLDVFHIDGLRLDAVHAIMDRSAYPVVAELADRVHALSERRGRPLYVIAETDQNDPRYVRARARGGLGLDGIWSDDFHHAVHVGLTREVDGYYADYADPGAIARAWDRRFVLDGVYSPFRERRHGADATDVPRDRFCVCIQNHDQVGNRGFGDRLTTLVSEEVARVGAALLLLSPYVPLLFMGEEYGETQPFLYFTSHASPELQAAVRDGRRSEFASFAWQGEVPDPGAETTFLASKLRWERRNEPPGSLRRELYRTLIELRRSEPALRPGASEIEVLSPIGEPWLAAQAILPTQEVRNGGHRALVVCVWQPGETTLGFDLAGRSFTRVLDTEEPRFGGAGARLPSTLAGAGDGTPSKVHFGVEGPVAGLYVEAP